MAYALMGVLLVPGAARAADASCGGLAPVDVACEAELTPSGSRVDITVVSDPTFVGLVEVRAAQGQTSISVQCPQASIVLGDCTGFMTGLVPGEPVTVSANILTVEGIPLSIGQWLVTATG